jgi:Ca2+-transporting ATPase
MRWHTLAVDETLRKLDSNLENGLTFGEVEKRLQQYGVNALTESAPPGFWYRLFTQFNNFVIYLLIFAAAASFFLGDQVEAIAILAIVLLNAFLGVVQEGRAEESLKSLKKLASPTVKVLREGRIERLEAGDYIPADLRLAETINDECHCHCC